MMKVMKKVAFFGIDTPKAFGILLNAGKAGKRIPSMTTPNETKRPFEAGILEMHEKPGTAIGLKAYEPGLARYCLS